MPLRVVAAPGVWRLLPGCLPLPVADYVAACVASGERGHSCPAVERGQEEAFDDTQRLGVSVGESHADCGGVAGRVAGEDLVVVVLGVGCFPRPAEPAVAEELRGEATGCSLARRGLPANERAGAATFTGAAQRSTGPSAVWTWSTPCALPTMIVLRVFPRRATRLR
jgi:hypothetical protein